MDDKEKSREQLMAELEAVRRELKEANRLKSQFLATISHELRTPLNAIIGFTRLVLRRGGQELSKRNRENLEKVQQSADHLLNMINDMLDLSRIEAGRTQIKPASCDVTALILRCCAVVAPVLGKPGVRLVQDVPDDLGRAFVDEARVRQIGINLLSNAFKFTDQGEVAIRARREGDALVLTVSDTGIGIPGDQIEAIFQAFRQVDGSHTRTHSGTGLGLALVKKLVDLLGGTIEVTSEVNRGTTFVVQLPAAFGRSEAQADIAPVEAPKSGEQVVVVIDDDPNVAVLMREELGEEGYRVVSATRADEGVELVRKLRPVAVTVDIIMPGKDGWETIAMLKSDPETRDVPVVVMSASDNRELGIRLGVMDYLVKPIDRDALLGVLSRAEMHAGKDVLVVDDVPTVRALLCDMLKLHGFDPRQAENGREALREIEKQAPDAIFLDLMMPVMDGFAVVAQLQARDDWKRIPVIVVTAKDLSDEEQAYLRDRVGCVMQKGDMDPISLGKDLKEVLKRHGQIAES